MDDAMHLDGHPRPSGSRKRTMRQRDLNSDEDEEDDAIASDDLDTPLKRLRNGSGDAVHRRVLRYNAHALLNGLAFTRLYVTANFQHYAPSSSPVIVCLVSEHRLLYRALCQVLPSLYGVAPTLQALAIAANPLDQSGVVEEELIRRLPFTTMAGLGDEIMDEFQRFAQSLPGPADSVVVINPSGTCVWTSDELDIADSCPVRGAAYLKMDLERVLLHLLRSMSPGDTMDEG